MITFHNHSNSKVLLWLLRGADLFLSLDFEFCILLLSCCALESTTQWRLSAIKVKLELEHHTKKKKKKTFKSKLCFIE